MHSYTINNCHTTSNIDKLSHVDTDTDSQLPHNCQLLNYNDDVDNIIENVLMDNSNDSYESLSNFIDSITNDNTKLEELLDCQSESSEIDSIPSIETSKVVSNNTSEQPSTYFSKKPQYNDTKDIKKPIEQGSSKKYFEVIPSMDAPTLSTDYKTLEESPFSSVNQKVDLQICMPYVLPEEIEDVLMGNYNNSYRSLDNFIESITNDNISLDNLIDNHSELIDPDSMTLIEESEATSNNKNLSSSKQHPTYLSTKRPYADTEDIKITEHSSSKKYCEIISSMEHTSQNTECKTPEESFFTFSNQQVSLQIGIPHVLPEELELVSHSYKHNDLCLSKLNISMYEYAIKKINVDNNNILNKAILMEIKNDIVTNGFIKSCIDVSSTYSNIRIYIANKISSYINDIINTEDIVTTPGMSISDIKDSYISNQNFFSKLWEHCKEMAKNICKIRDEEITPLIQNYVSSNLVKSLSNGTYKITADKKNNLSDLLKRLITENINNLPHNIKSAIRDFDETDILKSMFVKLHGTYVSKSFIKNAISIYTFDRLAMENESLKIDVSSIKIKLKKLFQESIIIIGGKIFSPNKSAVTLIIDHLLLDMNSIYSTDKTKLINEISQQHMSGGVDKSHINKDGEYYCEKALTTLDSSILPEILPEGIKLVSDIYNHNDIFSSKLNISIYEFAIKKINIDENKILSNAILECLGDKDTTDNISKSSIDISHACSNIREYISNEVSPYINKIMIIENIFMTPGMYLSDIHHKCVSNQNFFDRLYKHCKEIAKNIDKVKHKKFFHIIKNCIYFNTGSDLKVNAEKISSNEINKISPSLKSLIIDIIHNLPLKIKYVIENLDLLDVSECMFTQIHGVYIDKSLIGKIEKILLSKLMLENKNINAETYSGSIKKKLEYILQTSIILHDGKTFLPNKSIVSSMSDHLLLDIANTQSKLFIRKKAEKLLKQQSDKNKILESPTSFVNQDSNLQKQLKYVVSDKILLTSTKYRYNNICSAELTVSIYENAIKKINVDDVELLRDAILEEFYDRIKSKGLDKSLIDISTTYSNIIKYVSDKVSLYINYIAHIEDITITPGMSASDINHECTSNHAFFDKLRKCCINIEREIDKNPSEHFVPLVQRKIFFYSSTNFCIDIIGRRWIWVKNIFSGLIKKLAIDIVRNLPQKIKSVIEKFNQDDILENMFAPLHGVHLTKSLIKNIIDIYTTDKLMAENKHLKIEVDKDLIKNKLEKILEKSVVFHQGKAFSPNKYTTSLMVNYLLLDFSQNISERGIYHKLFVETEELKENHNKMNSNNEHKYCIESIKSIYECAIEKIIIDDDKVFMGVILKEFKNNIDSSSFNETCINLSVTYSNIVKYISDKISPYINRIVIIADVLITPGMSISYIKRKCMSNLAFFDRLYGYCKSIVKNVSEVPHENFLTLFDLGNETDINNVDINVKNRVLLALKFLIMDTIINLPEKIMFVIDKFEPIDISSGIFTTFHNINVTKLFIRNATDACVKISKEIRGNRSIKFSSYLLEKTKLEELAKKSVILVGETAFLPSESTAKSIVDHLLSDMEKISHDEEESKLT
ncbi:hypothetical protein [Candidatus Ichthyocystis sparus]|uniref:hypothetical protein n=1 Tax=Candidatus Ichthyocystis sparus TaxID=1561004 RepID=UPI000B899D16|nr:hypothetical protein [Candidatus Ichthyocystis sparus]